MNNFFFFFSNYGFYDFYSYSVAGESYVYKFATKILGNYFFLPEKKKLKIIFINPRIKTILTGSDEIFRERTAATIAGKSDNNIILLSYPGAEMIACSRIRYDYL